MDLPANAVASILREQHQWDTNRLCNDEDEDADDDNENETGSEDHHHLILYECEATATVATLLTLVPKSLLLKLHSCTTHFPALQAQFLQLVKNIYIYIQFFQNHCNIFSD